MLRPHILYLQGKGFEVSAVSNGEDALQLAAKEHFDAVLLDEMMPGLGGLAVLEALQASHPGLPVIMVTKSEEENLMDRRSDERISDYLTKPVNPSQVFLAIKKVLEGESAAADPEDARLRGGVQPAPLAAPRRPRLARLARPLPRRGRLGPRAARHAEREPAPGAPRPEGSAQPGVRALHRVALPRVGGEAPRGPAAALGRRLSRSGLLPHLQAGRRLALVVIDCMRLDQWRMLEPLVAPYFEVRTEHYYSILPTATPYARNAIFSGLYPLEISRRHPDWWLEDAPKEAGRNRYEKELMEEQLKRHRHRPGDACGTRRSTRSRKGTCFAARSGRGETAVFLAFVFNFLDMLAHGQSDSEILHELAPDEEALRRLLQSWFQHSVLLEVLRILSRQNTVVVVTSDHGLVHCRRPTVVLGNRETSTSIRYKFGDNLWPAMRTRRSTSASRTSSCCRRGV